MKKYLIFIAALSFFSCSDDDITTENYWGFVSANINGGLWSAQSQGVSNVYSTEHFNLGFDIYNSQNLWREHLWIRNIPKELNVFEVFKLVPDNIEIVGARYETLTSDGDVGCDIYSLLESANTPNVIEITTLENGGSLIEGNFNLTFLINDSVNKCNPNAPDTIRFTNGVFQTRITR